LPISKQGIEYAIESDLLNVAVFGFTAKQWQESNPELHLKKQNIRDSASINELAVLSNLESANSELIKEGIEKTVRFKKLKDMALSQLKILRVAEPIKSLKRLSDETYLDAELSMSNSVYSQKKIGKKGED